MTLPSAKNASIVVQRFGKELLIYDLSANTSYTLNETLMIVFESCDGKTTFDQLKRRFKFADELIFFVLDELKNANLLTESVNYISPFTEMSRRDVIKKVGLASLVAIPVIASLAAPTAAQSASCQANGQICTSANFSQGNCCSSTSRCFNSTCISCFGISIVFVAAPTNGACTNYAERNLCCNTASTPSGGNGAACVCP